MITIRGKTITVSQLTLMEGASVHSSCAVLGTCTPTIKVLLPENFPHLVRVVAVIARRHVPDVSLDEVSAALNPDNIYDVLNALTSGKRPASIEIHQEAGHA